MNKLVVYLVLLSFASNVLAVKRPDLAIGKVDIQRIILSIKEGKKVRKKLEKEFNKKREILKKEENSIRSEQKKFGKRSLLMNAQKKREEETKLEKKVIDLQKKTVEFQKQIQKMEKELKKPILDKLKTVVAKVSKSAKVFMTFEVSSTPVVYAEKEIDLTKRVIAAYDKKHPVKKKK